VRQTYGGDARHRSVQPSLPRLRHRAWRQQTSADTLERILGLLRQCDRNGAEDALRSPHLKECGPHSYIFEAVYFVLDPDYNVYMDIHQAGNLEIIRTFESEHIEFAYATKTLLIAQQEDAMQDNRT
jgi:hypothetical protein